MFVCPKCAATSSDTGFCRHDGSPLVPSADDPLIGAKVGPYQVDALIGVGGMGHVYRAIHPNIGSRVAVKVLSHDCALKPELVARFFDEARAVNMIRHESIVNIVDLDHLPDRRPYIVMEFLDGKPLSSYTNKGTPLPIGTVLHTLEDVLAALDAAHQQRIVHRDLKPDNIFISPKGRPKVLDFGIAKLVSDESSLEGQTKAGSLLGTPHYMSPEQAMGRSADARSDLYAIGVILYECLTGQAPFHSDNLFKLLQLHVDAPPREPRAIRPALSQGLEAVVLRALAKDPDHRWQRASDFMQALQAEQQGLADSEWIPFAVGGTAIGAMHSPSRPPSVQTGPQAEHQRRGAVSAPPPVHKAPVAKSRSVLWPMVALGAVAVAGLLWASQVGDSSSETASVVAAIEPGEEPAAAAMTDAGTVTSDITALASPVDARAMVVASAELPVDAGRKPAKNSSNRKNRRRAAPEAEIEVATTVKVGAKARPTVPTRDSIKTKSAGQFDVSGYLSKAKARARKTFDDAVLLRIDAVGVRANGKANLTLSSAGAVVYRFISPSRSKGVPRGATNRPTCLFYVNVQARETDNYVVEGWDCSKLAPVGRPRCTAKEVWQRAIADGAPKNSAVAELGYRKNSGAKTWYFSIKGVLSKRYPDDC